MAGESTTASASNGDQKQETHYHGHNPTVGLFAVGLAALGLGISGMLTWDRVNDHRVFDSQLTEQKDGWSRQFEMQQELTKMAQTDAGIAKNRVVVLQAQHDELVNRVQELDNALRSQRR